MDIGNIIFKLLGIFLVFCIFTIPVIIVFYLQFMKNESCKCNINKYLSNIVIYWTIFITLYFIFYTILISINKDFRSLLIYNKYLGLILIILSLFTSIYLFYLIGNLQQQQCLCIQKIEKIHKFLVIFRYFIIFFVSLIIFWSFKQI